MVMSGAQPVFAGESHKNIKLIGSWILKDKATDSSGNPCPFVPERIEIFKDQTMTMSNFGSKALPYKTKITEAEKQMIEERNPDLKGKNLLLVKPNPGVDWLSTPMVYGYSVEKNVLTLMLQGWSPAKFERAVR
jgi:hypothetical protein